MIISFPYQKPKSSVPRSVGVCRLGWAVILSNVALYGIYYSGLVDHPHIFIQRITALISMVAVFPYDLFTRYFSFQWPLHIVWVMMTVMCAFGILFLNKAARSIFIILNILHLVALWCLLLFHVYTTEVVDYFFKFYFTVVASGSYMAFLTLPEIQKQFQVDLEAMKVRILLNRPLGRKVQKSDARKYADLSVAYMRMDRYAEAVDALTKAIQGDPSQAEYYFRLGMVYIKQRLSSEAIAALQMAVQRDPLHYEAYYNLGVLYVQSGCSREAAEMFLKATHVRPQEAQAYRDLGDAYFSSGRFEDAVQQFYQAIALSRGDVYSYYRVGCIATEYLDRQQDALEALRAAVKIKKDFCDAYFQLGKVCIKLKRFKEAVRLFKHVVQLEEDHVQGRYYLGFCYVMLKDYHSARSQCQVLKKYDEDLAENLQMLLTV